MDENYRNHPITCSWCQKVMKEGNPDLAISHGICPSCRERVLREMEENRKKDS